MGAKTYSVPLWAILLFVALQFLAPLYISENFKSYLDRQNKEREQIREQAAKVGEYLSYVYSLHSPEDFRQANQLAFELAMWLPADIYKDMGPAIKSGNEKNNIFSIIIRTRKFLLEDKAGDLTEDNLIIHAPGIGNQLSK